MSRRQRGEGDSQARQRRSAIVTSRGAIAVPPAFHRDAIGGSGEYFGDNDSHLGRMNVFHHEALAASTCLARCYSTSSPA
jgi:hypothetical protein